MSGIPTGMRTPRASIGAPAGRKSIGPSAIARPLSSNGDRDRAYEELMRSSSAASTKSLAKSLGRKPSAIALRDERPGPAGSGRGTPPTPAASIGFRAAQAPPKTPAGPLGASVRSGAARPAAAAPAGDAPDTAKRIASHSAATGAEGGGGPAARQPKVGDRVSGAGMEGTLSFWGAIDGKMGVWAGVDLSGTEWEGKGKNDGTAAGKPYFSCPPLCGIFVPAGKVTVLASATFSPSIATTALPEKVSPLSRSLHSKSLQPPTASSRAAAKSSAEAARLAQSRITEGSRASKYLGMTAAQLASRPPRPPTRPTSPEKPSTSRGNGAASPSKAYLASATTTPRAPRSRPSLGASHAGGRKSVGPSGPPPGSQASTTPRRSLGRPGSVTGTRKEVPDVPPLPPGFCPGTPTPTSRRTEHRAESGSEFRTPGAPASAGSGHVRRPSVAPPAAYGRPESALSMSASGRSSVLSVDRFVSEERAERDRELRETRYRAEELERKLREAEEARRKAEEGRRKAEGEATQAVEEKERKGREAEELAERAVRAEEALAAGTEEQGATRAAERKELDDLKAQHSELCAARDALASKLASASAEAESMQKQLGDAQAGAEAERSELTSQLDELRSAGQALCEVYEEKISAATQARLEAQESLIHLEKELGSLRARAAQGGGGAAGGGGNGGAGASGSGMAGGGYEFGGEPPSANRASAAEIDNESLRADLRHARNRLSELQEQLDEARDQLGEERAEKDQRAVERGEAYTKAREELRKAKEELVGAGRYAAEQKARMAELEGALADARRAQENERAELEALRGEAMVAQEVGQLRQQLAELDRARKDLKEQLERTREREQDLKDELELVGEIKVLEREGEADEVKRLRRELEAKDQQVRRLRQQPVAPGSAPTNIDTGTAPASCSPSPSLPHCQLGAKRDSVASTASKRSYLGGGSPILSRDETAVMKEQIVGLKSIITQMNAERAELEEAQKQAQNQAEDLRDANRALEATVDNLVNAAAGSGSAVQPALDRRGASNRLEADVETLKARIGELERKHAREVKLLNKEVSELESLVEAKIFKEDELENEIAQYKSIIAAVKANGQMVDAHVHTPDRSHSRKQLAARLQNGGHRHLSASPTPGPRGRKASCSSSEIERQWAARGGDGLLSPTSTGGLSHGSDGGPALEDEDACELCGEGHRLEDCPIFGGTSGLDGAKAWRCSNCESDDHDSEECPHGDEIF